MSFTVLQQESGHVFIDDEYIGHFATPPRVTLDYLLELMGALIVSVQFQPKDDGSLFTVEIIQFIGE